MNRLLRLMLAFGGLICAGSGLVLPGTAHGLVSASTATPYSSCIARYANRYQLEGNLVKGVVATESNWDPNARSSANAHGLMQIQWPGTARHLGVTRKSQLYQPCRNIELGTRYLRELVDRYRGDERLALAAYNYGPGRIAIGEPIPRGAQRYVAKVYKNAALFGTTVATTRAASQPPARRALKKPATSPAKTDNQALVAFSSRHRAQRYVRLLARRIEGANFRMQAVDQGRYQVWMQVKPMGLSRDEKLILASLGWTL